MLIVGDDKLPVGGMSDRELVSKLEIVTRLEPNKKEKLAEIRDEILKRMQIK